MIEYLKQLDNITIRELARGILSESSLSRIINEDQDINAVYFYYLIRRLGVSPERFRIMADTKDYEYFTWLDQCQEYIKERRYPELIEALEQSDLDNRFRAYGKLPMREKDYFTYVLEADYYHRDEKAFKFLIQSIDYMISNDAMLIPGHYSAEEINRFFNYLDISLQLKKISTKHFKTVVDRLLQFMRMNPREPIEEAKLYPRVICAALINAGHLYSSKKAENLLKEAYSKLEKTVTTFDLPELLRQLESVYQSMRNPEINRVQHWYEAIQTVYDLANLSTAFNKFSINDSEYHLYLMHEYLRNNRIRNSIQGDEDISQREISEGIMEPENYNRVERGKSRLQKKNFKALANKLEVNDDLYLGEIRTPYLEDYGLLTEINQASNRGDLERLEVSYEKLNSHLDRQYPENRQYLEQAETDIRILKKEISEFDSLDTLMKILNYTLPYKPDEYHSYTGVEKELLYRVVRIKRKYSVLEDTDVAILKACIKSEEKNAKVTWRRIGILKRLLAGILQTSGQLEESEVLCRADLRTLLKSDHAFLLMDYLDILAESILYKNKEEAKQLMQATYWIGDLYQKDAMRDAMAGFYQSIFNESIL